MYVMLLSNLNARFDKNRGKISKTGIPPPEKAPSGTVLQEPSARGSHLRAISKHLSLRRRAVLPQPRGRRRRPGGSGRRGLRPGQGEAGAGGPTAGAPPGAGAEGREARAAVRAAREGTSGRGALTVRGRALPPPARRSAAAAPAPGGAGQGMSGRGGAFRRRSEPRAGCAAAAASRRSVPVPIPMPVSIPIPMPMPPRLLLPAARAGARPAPLPGRLLRQRPL